MADVPTANVMRIKAYIYSALIFVTCSVESLSRRDFRRRDDIFSRLAPPNRDASKGRSHGS
jgi:hypothetical protein